MEGARLIALNRSAAYCRTCPLKHVLPVRRKRTGSRPGVRGEGPMGAERGDQEQWVFPTVTLSKKDKHLIMAEVTSIIVEIMFNTHLYTFGGKTFQQREGGPIGLRGTCALARLVMCVWDRRWNSLMEQQRIVVDLYSRYMDDGRMVLPPIKTGWRWKEGCMQYTEAWKVEDQYLSPVEVTRRVLDGAMQEVLTFLTLTTEVGDEEGWLPTLDLNLRMEGNNMVSWKYYEKPTTTNVTVQRRSALEENSKMQILSNDLVRRLASTDGRQERKVICAVIDQYAQKLLTSGYNLEQVRRIILNGIRGWERRKARAEAEGRKVYRTGKESAQDRYRKKILGKTEWFRKTGRKEDKLPTTLPSKKKGVKNQRRSHRKAGNRKAGQEMKTRSVLFVENTRNGELARTIKEVCGRLEEILGYRIKVVERAGTPLKLLFPLGRLDEGTVCGRPGCITCNQEGENKIPPCTKRSLVYENICTKCNPKVTKEGGMVTPPETFPSIYIGETSRSIAERGKEHWRGYKEGRDDSHIWKHHVLHHGAEGQPTFLLRPVQYFNSALTRQIAEAVLIGRLGEGVVLNSKSEYNRCKLGRLILGDKTTTTIITETNHEESTILETINKNQEGWEKGKAKNRRQEEMKNIQDGHQPQHHQKRKQKNTTLQPPPPKRKAKKRIYPLIQEGWGEDEDDLSEKKEDDTISPSPGTPPIIEEPIQQPNRTVAQNTTTTTPKVMEGQPTTSTTQTTTIKEGCWPLFGGVVGSGEHCPTSLNSELAPAVGSRAEKLKGEETPKNQKQQKCIMQYLNAKKQGKQNIIEKQDAILSENTEEILIDIEETENTVQNTELPVVPSNSMSNNYEKKKADRPRCAVKNSRCITHKKKLRKEMITKQKRVIGKDGILEVRNIDVPILVCPDRHNTDIARPDINSALGEDYKNNRQDNKNNSNLPGAQLIEGKVLEGLLPQTEVADNT